MSTKTSKYRKIYKLRTEVRDLYLDPLTRFHKIRTLIPVLTLNYIKLNKTTVKPIFLNPETNTQIKFFFRILFQDEVLR